MSVKLPHLLDSSLAETAVLNPSRLSVDLKKDPVSSADMTVPMDAEIPMRGWIELYTIHGSAGIYRVSQMDTDYDRNEQRLALEHGVCVLNDAILTGDTELSKTPSQWLDTLLAKQTVKRGNTSFWAKGTVTPTTTVYLTPGGSTLLNLIQKMMDQLPDYTLSFDQSSFPWTISIVAKQSSVTAEGRLSRNLSSVRVSYDDSDLCTRVYANGLSNGYKDADTTGTYGIVEQYLSLDADISSTDANRIADRYLRKRKEPAISVSLDAVDLSAATGETFDAFTLGKKFRLAMPAYNVTVEQWITGVKYEDVFAEPEHVTLTLANMVADLSTRMARTTKTADEADRQSSYNQTQINRNYVKLSAHERVMTGNGTTADYQSYINIKAHGTEIAQITQKTGIEGLGTSETLLSKINVSEGNITTLVAKTGIDSLGQNQTLYSKITQNAEDIELKVSSSDYNGNEIVSKINLSSTTIDISASKINLSGYVTASQLSTTNANITNLINGTTTASKLRCTEFWLGGYQCYLANGYVRYGLGD